MPSTRALHVWFADGWQFHYFSKHGTAVVVSAQPGARSMQPLSPPAEPYFAAVCQNPKLAAACQERLGVAPWEMDETPPQKVENPPAIVKVRWQE